MLKTVVFQRKPIFEDERKMPVRLSARIPRELKNSLALAAKSRHASMSRELMKAIEIWLDAHSGKSNDIQAASSRRSLEVSSIMVEVPALLKMRMEEELDRRRAQKRFPDTHTSLIEEALRDYLSQSHQWYKSDATAEDALFPDPVPETEGIELYLDIGDASDLEVRAVLGALNELHKTSGGLGLEFHIDGTLLLARQEVPA